MRRYLVVANETLGDSRLVEAVKQRMAEGACHFHVVVPVPGPTTIFGAAIAAYQGAGPDDDDSRAAAADALDVELARLGALGADVDGEVGSHDALEAIRAALDGDEQRDRYDQIILAALPAGPSKWFHADLRHRITKAFGIPVSVTQLGTAHRAETAATTGPANDAPPAAADADAASRVPADLDQLERDIERVRLRLARLEHRDGRHFIDDDRQVTASLDAHSARLRHLAALHWAAPATSTTGAHQAPGGTESRIRKLDDDIEHLRQRLAAQANRGEHHFCD